MSDYMTGEIRSVTFEDGIQRGPDCGLEECPCPDHEIPARRAGTYLTIRLDDSFTGAGPWRVRIERVNEETEGGNGGERVRPTQT